LNAMCEDVPATPMPTRANAFATASCANVSPPPVATTLSAPPVAPALSPIPIARTAMPPPVASVPPGSNPWDIAGIPVLDLSDEAQSTATGVTQHPMQVTTEDDRTRIKLEQEAYDVAIFEGWATPVAVTTDVPVTATDAPTPVVAAVPVPTAAATAPTLVGTVAQPNVTGVRNPNEPREDSSSEEEVVITGVLPVLSIVHDAVEPAVATADEYDRRLAEVDAEALATLHD
jgi:hypothetical protein